MNPFEKLFGGEKTAPIVSLTRLTLRESGMRYVTEYELLPKEGAIELSRYGIRFHSGDDERVLEQRALADPDRVLALLNDCRLLSWDGFNGPHPKGVLDGIMFRLRAEVNEGATISAQGSQNFPRRYHQFRDGLRELLDHSAL